MADLGLKSFDKLYPMMIRKYKDLIIDQNANEADKINQIIQKLNALGKLSNDVVRDWNTVYNWAMNDGLTTDVNNKLEQMLANHEFDPIMNDILTKIGDLTTLQTADKDTIVHAINDNVASLAQSTSDLLAREFNVKSPFGTNVPIAKGDGSTDDTASIMGAINYLVSLGGGTVYLPAGTYKSAPINVPPLIKIKGAGEYLTTLSLKTGSNADFLTFDQAQASGVHDITIDGNKWNNNNTSGSAIVIKNSQVSGKDNSRNLKIEQVHINGAAEHGIKIVAPYVWIFALRFIKIDNCGGYGIWNNATDNSYYAIDIFGCGSGAVYDAGTNNHWNGGKWYSNGTGARTNSTLYVNGAHRTTYANIEMQDNYGHGVTINNATDISFSAVTSDSCGVMNVSTDNHTPAEASYRILGSRRINFVGCIATNYLATPKQAYGLVVDGGSSDITYDITFAEDQITTTRSMTTSAGIVDLSIKRAQQAFTSLGVPTNIFRPNYLNGGGTITPVFATGTTISGLQMLWNGSMNNALDFTNSSPANIFAGSSEWTLEFEIEITQLPTTPSSFSQLFAFTDGTNYINITANNSDSSRLPLSIYAEWSLGGSGTNITIDTTKIANFNTGIKYYLAIVKTSDFIYYYVNGLLMGNHSVSGSINQASITNMRFRSNNGLQYILRNVKFSKIARSRYELNQNWTVDEYTTVLMPLQSDLSVGHGISFKYQTGTSLPTASATYRNVIFTVQGGTSVADIMYQCMKSSTDTYSWKQIISG